MFGAPLPPFSLSPLHCVGHGNGNGNGIGIDANRYNLSVHEMGIALEVYRTCRETIEAHGGGRLRQARLAVGELSAVEPDLLVFAWEAVLEDGPDEGADLIIDWHPADQHCAGCGESKDRASGSWMRLCPDCGMPLEVSGGSELDIVDLSFETAEATG